MPAGAVLVKLNTSDGSRSSIGGHGGSISGVGAGIGGSGVVWGGSSEGSCGGIVGSSMVGLGARISSLNMYVARGMRWVNSWDP